MNLIGAFRPEAADVDEDEDEAVVAVVPPAVDFPLLLPLDLSIGAADDTLPLLLEEPSPKLPPSSINLSVSGSNRKSPFFRIGLFRRSDGLNALCSNDDLLPVSPEPAPVPSTQHRTFSPPHTFQPTPFAT